MRQTLKAWIHWVKKNPIDDDQLQHALETERVLNELAEANARLEIAQKALETVERLIHHMSNDAIRVMIMSKVEPALAKIRGMG